jgi:hypothetical protein
VGGQAVTLAAHDAPADLDLRGIIAFAPTTYSGGTYDRPPTELPYLQFFGLADGFVGLSVSRSDDHTRGVPAWDREQRERTLVALADVGHGNFNDEWYLSGHPASFLPAGSSQEELYAALRPLVGAFAHEHLLGGVLWRGYLQGLVRPAATRRFDVRYLHERVHGQRPYVPVVVVDSFGNGSPELGHTSVPDRPEVNDLGLPNRFEGFEPPLPQEYAVPPLETREDEMDQPATALLHDAGVRYLALETRGGGEAAFVLGELEVLENWFLHLSLASGARLRPDDDEHGPYLQPAGVPNQLRLTLVDVRGNRAAVNTRSVGGLPREVVYYWSVELAYASTFSSLRLPLSAFVGANPRLDLSRLAEVKLTSVERSSLALRSIEFTP